LSGLAVAEGGAMTPMQAFQLRTAFDDLACNEAPSLLAVQGPEGLTVDISANGAQIRMASLVVLRTLAPGDVMQAFTIEGDVTLEPDSVSALQLLPGFSTTRCLGEDGNSGADCDWTEPQPLTEEEQVWVETVLAAYAALDQSGPAGVSNDETCTDGTSVQHTVQSGDTLFSLGQRYNTTVSAIVYRNNLTSSLIFVGQVLSIVCGEVGPASLPPDFDQSPNDNNPPNPPPVDPNGGNNQQPPPRSPNNPANPPPTATPPRITR
jgi:LysM repeat protein